jgi:hypothetical protein
VRRQRPDKLISVTISRWSVLALKANRDPALPTQASAIADSARDHVVFTVKTSRPTQAGTAAAAAAAAAATDAAAAELRDRANPS